MLIAEKRTRKLRTFSLSTCSSGMSLIDISLKKKKKLPWIFLNISRKLTKSGSKIAFYVGVNVFSLSNLTIFKADISKTSSERYQFLFIFVCRTSNTPTCKKKKKKKTLPCGQLRTSGFKDVRCQ